MEEINSTVNYFTSPAFIGSVITVAITGIIMYVIKKYLIKKVAYTGKDSQHRNTLIGVAFNVLQYLCIIICGAIVLKINGINLTGILTGLGIVATIVGLSLQDTLKDIFSGINIYNNNFYKVGDMVRYNGEMCDVKYFSARITKFQSVKTNSTYTVCNSAITSIEKIKDRGSREYYFSFEEDKKKIDKAFEKIVKRFEGFPNLKMITYDGISAIEDKGVSYEIKYLCPAHKQEKFLDELAAVSYEEFKKAGIRPIANGMYK